MSKSLAELRASAHTKLPERTYSLCLAQGLVAEVQRLEEERTEILLEQAGEEGQSKRPRRGGEGPNPRLAEIDARLAELYEEMREHTGSLRLRGINAGKWRRWIDDNPPRIAEYDPQGKPILNPLDIAAAYGYCNSSALAETLGEYAAAWNDEPLDADGWAFIAQTAAPGDLKELCKIVVQMHEAVGSRAPGKSQKPSSKTTPDESDSDSLAS